MTAESATVSQLPVAAAPPAAPPAAFNERDAFELALRKAKVFAASTLVPAQFQDNIPNCLIALNMAKRIGADELMVCQNLHIVQGKPGWSGQFLIATFNQCGRFTAMRFEWKGEEGSKEWGCRAYATEKATGEKITGSWVTWKMVEAEGWSKKSGSKWLTMPAQMFHYRAAAFLVRAYAPEIAMGLQTVEEIRDVIDVYTTPEAPTKTDAVTAALKAKLTPAVTLAEAAASAAAYAAPPMAEQLNNLARPPLELDGSAPVISFAGVMDALHASEKQKNADALGLAEDMIRYVPDEQQRAELDVEAKRIRKALA